MKKLICAKEVEAAILEKKSTIIIDHHTIITPSAKDLAKLHDIAFVYEEQSVSVAEGTFDMAMVLHVFETMAEKGMLQELLQQIQNRLNNGIETVDGVQILRLENLKKAPFNEGEKNCKSIISDEKGPSVCYLALEKESYAIETVSSKALFILEGTAQLQIGDQTCTLQEKDFVKVPKDKKIVLCTETEVKGLWVS